MFSFFFFFLFFFPPIALWLVRTEDAAVANATAAALWALVLFLLLPLLSLLLLPSPAACTADSCALLGILTYFVRWRADGDLELTERQEG